MMSKKKSPSRPKPRGIPILVKVLQPKPRKFGTTIRSRVPHAGESLTLEAPSGKKYTPVVSHVNHLFAGSKYAAEVTVISLEVPKRNNGARNSRGSGTKGKAKAINSRAVGSSSSGGFSGFLFLLIAATIAVVVLLMAN